MDAPQDGPRDDRVLGRTRALALFIAPFLVVAFVILYLVPGHTARLWSWTIPVTTTSRVLASAYLGGAWFFLRVARGRRWHEVGAGFPAVATFAGLLGIATVLHWDAFAHDHLAFWLWAGLYFTAPFLVLAAWLANRRYAAPVTVGDVVLRPAERVVVGAIGVLALGFGLFMFLSPGSVDDLWPWPLTPLTARVVAATFRLGAAGVGVWADPRWTSLRLMAQVEAMMLVLMLLAAVLGRDEMVAGHALGWPLLAGMLLVLAGTAYLWLTYELRPRRAARPRGLDELDRRHARPY
jgi:hypothetical protein